MRKRLLPFLLLPALLAGACSDEPPITPGADLDAAGPQFSGEPPGAGAKQSSNAPASVAPVTPASAVPSKSMTPLETLRTRTLTALADENAVAGASLTVEQRAAAGGQLVFKWTTSNNPEDERAPAGLRVQSLLILEQARLSGLVFDSVLLIASAVVFDSSERRTEVIAARAKYSKALVLRTDFTKVAPSAVFQLPDDKPAELDPRFK